MTYDNNDGPIYSVLIGKTECYCCEYGCEIRAQSVCSYCYSDYAECIAANSNGC
jgi:hypothetical protein